jgi:hypothetical protein
MDVDCHKILSTLPNVEKKLCPHLLTTNTRDKQSPWYPISTIQKIEHLAFQLAYNNLCQFQPQPTCQICAILRIGLRFKPISRF